MRRALSFAAALGAAGALVATGLATAGAAASHDFEVGDPAIESMGVLAFGPDGVLLVGDNAAGAIWAVDLDEEGVAAPGRLAMADVEGKIGALLGTTGEEILIHDLAVNPVSRAVYLSVSRNRGQWDSAWELPNDLGTASVLVRVDGGGDLEVVELEQVRFARVALPNPVADREHSWKAGVSLRADTITDMSVAEGTLFVAGLSNEEFASTMWRVPYPLADGVSATTLEIFHGAHGEYETHAPIRTFVPYELGGEAHVLAAYLCTPLVTFRVADLENGSHLAGRTVGEFGAGNYPLDMVVYQKDGRDRLLIANSNLPLMIVDPADIEAFEGAITEPTEEYMAGVSYEPRSGVGILQLDRLDDETLVMLKRLPGGTVEMTSAPARRF